MFVYPLLWHLYDHNIQYDQKNNEKNTAFYMKFSSRLMN